MEKVTIDKAKDEVLDFLISAFGTSIGIVLMKGATRYGVNQWLVPGIGLVSGVALRVMGKSNFLKALGTGVGIAGAADLTKKGLDFAATKIPALSNFTSAVPSFSGFPSDPINYATPNSSLLRGLRGLSNASDYVQAEVVSSALLR